MLGDAESALKDCNEAIRLAPDVPAFYDSRALVYYQMQDYEQALVEENRSMTEASWENYILRAAIYHRLGETKLARSDYRAARKHQKDREELKLRLSRLGLTPADF